MRTVPFREVLHGVAYKMGLDPDQSNFLTNQAIPIGTYIDEWVRRTYDARDWPEWVVTHRFAPSAHVVTWDAASLDFVSASHPLGAVLQIGRVYKVFLVDPSTTSAPVDTPFTLRDNGIHVGFEHGTSVWIRFMVPPPRYTAVEWRSDAAFAKDDITYSYTTGHVYKSKSNGNIGHNPAATFSMPPVPHVIEPLPPAPAPSITTTQDWIPTNPGISERNKIMLIGFTELVPGPDPTTVPPVDSVFTVVVADVDLVPLSTFGESADGVETLDDILNLLKTQLDTDLIPLGFTVALDTTLKTITLTHNSDFNVQGYYSADLIVVSYLRFKVIQSYIPTFSAASGQPQITRVAMTDESTIPGATYELIVTDSLSVAHTVEYESQLYDSAAQILQGLMSAAEAAQGSDEFWGTVTFTFDPDATTLDLSIHQNFSVDAPAPPPGSSWWQLVPFPAALADQVMTGALGDLLFEWGQGDKAGMEDQKVPLEAGVAESKFSNVPDPPLTGQERGLSRYKLQ